MGEYKEEEEGGEKEEEERMRRRRRGRRGDEKEKEEQETWPLVFTPPVRGRSAAAAAPVRHMLPRPRVPLVGPESSLDHGGGVGGPTRSATVGDAWPHASRRRER